MGEILAGSAISKKAISSSDRSNLVAGFVGQTLF